MALPLWQKHNVARAMKSKEMPLKKQANEVIAIREQLQAEQERQQQLYAAWTQYPPAVNVLKVLTDLLPDDTSLQQMDIKGVRLILRGKSSQASSLIKLLEESTGFSDVKFMSSVVQQRGKEQFHLSANIVMPFVQIVAEDIVEPAPDEEPPASETAPEEATEATSKPAPGESAEPVSQPAPLEPVTAPTAPPLADAPATGSRIRNSGGVSESAAPSPEPIRQATPLGSASRERPAGAASVPARLISGAGG